MKGDYLIRIVESLSGSERRCLQSHLKQVEGKCGKGLRSLFRLAVAHPAANEEELRMLLRPLLSKDKFDRLKRRLIDEILIATRSQSGSLGADFQFYSEILDAQWLFDHGFYAESKKLIEQCASRARKGERFLLLIAMSRLRSKLMLLKPVEDGLAASEELYEEIERHLHCLKEIIELQKANTLGYLRLLKNQGASAVDEEEQEMLPTKALKIKPSSIRATLNFYTLQELRAELASEPDSALLHKRKKVQLYEDHAELFVGDPDAHVKVLLNYLGAASQREDFSQHEVLLPRLASLIKKLGSLGDRYLCMYEAQDVIWRYRTGRFEALRDLLKSQVIPNFEARIQFLSKTHSIVLMYNYGVCYFVMEDFDDSFSWFSRLISELPKSNIRPDVQIAARLFFLLSCFELKYRTYFANLLDKLYRQLNYRSRIGPWERLVFRMGRRLAKATDQKAEHEIYCRTEREIQQEFKGKTGLEFLGRKEILAWLAARKNQRSIVSCFSER